VDALAHLEYSGAKHGIAEGRAKDETLGDGTRQGRNDFRRIGYGGPCPPPGESHRYFFKVYALDAKLDLKPGATKEELERAMKRHALAQGKLMGKYGQ
jgi:Raf kinase inhibitor-like YbhB/YbcL family protein